MTRLKNVLLLTTLLPIAAACSGGSGAQQTIGGSTLTGSFSAEQASPGTKTTAMAPGSTTGDLVTVRVDVTDTNGIYGASFDVTFDPAHATFVDWNPGSLLETGGHTPTYQLDESQPGILVVAATRNGNVPAVNASGTRNLVNLVFRVTATGDNPLTFGSPQLYDGQVPPQPISGVSWFAGSLHAD